MAELAPRARLQPSLLDRLVDQEPGNTQESRDRRVLSFPQLKAAVLRDLIWLLNTPSQLDAEVSNFREVAKSVVNYGVPSLTGRTATGLRPLEVEQMLARAIERYEPRILSRTLRVHVLAEKTDNRPNSVVMEIEGDLWAQPLPEALYIRTAVDLETGNFTMEER